MNFKQRLQRIEDIFRTTPKKKDQEEHDYPVENPSFNAIQKSIDEFEARMQEQYGVQNMVILWESKIGRHWDGGRSTIGSINAKLGMVQRWLWLTKQNELKDED